MIFALAGNQNCGKTTLFNQLTGSNQHVGNFPGVTVERKEGVIRGHAELTVVDLPGIYSLSPYSMEEIVARDFIVGERPDAIIDIIDATNIERNLYLTAQLLELERPMVIALNFMDEVEKHGDHIDVAGLSKALGVPVIPITARSGENIQTLLEAAHRQMHVGVTIEPDDLYDGFTHQIHHKVGELIHDKAYAAHIPAHWASIKLIEGDALVEKALGLSQKERDELEAVCREYEGAYDLGDRETLIADARYQFIQTVVAQCVRRGRPLGAPTLSDRIDAIVTHKVLAIPVFLLMMLCMFALTFGPGQMLADGVDAFIGGWFAGGVRSLLAAAGTAPWVEALLVDGVIAGVGGVLTFLPQIAILFLFLSFLEDSGYMARAAFIMDRLLRRFGLSGKAFIPMLMGFGCTVPAVMGARTMENEKDRRMTIMTTTMIPCGAKLPIIALVFGALAGGDYEATWWVAPVFYFLGLFAIILSCIILKKFRAFSGEVAPFIMELPQYHLPTVKNVLLSMWERVRSYVVKAGTIIFLSSMVIWFLLNFGFYEGSFGLLDPEVDDYIQYSLMAGLGNLLAWIFAPLGFGNWESTVTSITGLVAKENVVATVGVITSLGEEIGETDPSLWASFAAMLGGSSAAIMAFCAFNLLCAPCFAAIGTIRRQMMSAKWTWAAIGYMCAFAWCVGLMIYQFGGLIAGEIAFGPFTALAVVVAAGMLYLLFRPAAKPKGAGRLEAARKNA